MILLVSFAFFNVTLRKFKITWDYAPLGMAQWVEHQPANWKSPVRVLVRAHAWIVGEVPSWEHARGPQEETMFPTSMFLSLSFSLPSLLSKKQVCFFFFKEKKVTNQQAIQRKHHTGHLLNSEEDTGTGRCHLALVSPTQKGGRKWAGESWYFPQVCALPQDSSWSRFVCTSHPGSVLIPQLWVGSEGLSGCSPSSLCGSAIHQIFPAPALASTVICGQGGFFPSHRPLCFPKITPWVWVFACWWCYLRSTLQLLPPETSRVNSKQRLHASVGAWSP